MNIPRGMVLPSPMPVSCSFLLTDKHLVVHLYNSRVFSGWCPNIATIRHTNHKSHDENEDGESLVTYDETVEYQCIVGYTRTAGDFIRRCLSSGELDGADLVCQRKHQSYKFIDQVKTAS